MSILVSLIDNSLYMSTLKEVLDRIETEINEYTSMASMNENSKLIRSLILNQIGRLSTLDEFNDYISSFASLIVDPPEELEKDKHNIGQRCKMIQSNSFLGKFIVKILLSVKVMSFDELLSIWKGFCEYKKPLTSEVCVKELVSGDELEEKQLWMELLDQTKLGVDAHSIDYVISQEDLVRLFVFQITRIQTSSEPVPDSVKEIMKNIAQMQCGSINKSYYIEYLQLWKSGDYENSLNAMHRYFDYMMSSKQKYYYHYALLALATLHSSFGCDNEAIRAINEAIMVAREARDYNCLNYLLAWLFDFLNSRPHLEIEGDMSRVQILEFLELKSKERRNSALHCVAFMNKATMALNTGKPMIEVNDNLTRASYLSLHSPVSTPQINNIIHVCRMTGQMWWLIGEMDNLVETYLDIGAKLSEEYQDCNEMTEINIMRSQLACEKKHFKEALNILKRSEQSIKSNLNLQKKWKIRHYLIQLERLIDIDGDMNQGLMILSNLKAIGKEISHVDLKYEIDLMESRFLIWLGNVTDGLQLVTDGLTKMKKSSSTNYWVLKYQLKYGEIMGQRGISIVMSAIHGATVSGLGKIVQEGNVILDHLCSS